MIASPFAAVMLLLLVVTVVRCESQGIGSAASDQQAQEDAQLRKHNAEIERKKKEREEDILAKRAEIHDQHIRDHENLHQTEHAQVSEHVKHKFHASRLSAKGLTSSPPTSWFEVFLLAIIIGAPFAIFVVWHYL